MSIADLAMGIIGMVLQGQQRERQAGMEELNVLSNLFNQTGSPEAYTSMQNAAKKLGIEMPALGQPQQAKPSPSPTINTMGPVDPKTFNPIASILSSIGGGQEEAPPSFLPPTSQSATPPSMTQEESLLGPSKKYEDFSGEVATEMGIDPKKLIGGEPLKKYRQESFMRYRQYLKDRESQLKSMMLEDRKEKHALTMEEKREKARLELETERERAADERQTIRETKADERQAKRDAAAEKRLYKSQAGLEGRLDKRLSKEKSKLTVIYGPGGKTKMVPVSSESEYEPPPGWSLSKPSKEETQLQMLMGGGQQSGKIPVYDINGNLLRYE